MSVASKRVQLGLGITSGAAWVAMFAAAVVPHNTVTLMLVLGSMAVTATLSGVLLYLIPRMFECWRDGVAYGREAAAREVATVPTQRGTSVRELRAVR